LSSNNSSLTHAARVTRTSGGQVVPARETPAHLRDKDNLRRAVKVGADLVRVGLKNPGDARGFWRGALLLRSDTKDAVLKRLSRLPDVKLVELDPLLPIVTFRVPSAEALDAIAADSSVDYVEPALVPSSDLTLHDGCAVADWNGSPLYSMPNGMADKIGDAFKETLVDRAWSYANGAGVTIGYVDSGIDNSGSWPEISAMSGRLTTLQPNSGGCSHGTRMALVTAGPANGTGSVGVAFYASVIMSDLGGTVFPSGTNAYDALHRLYLSGGMPAGSKIIAFGFGLSGEYPAFSDLIDLGYYTRGFAFFSPAGSVDRGLPVVYPATKPEVFAVTARISTFEWHTKAHVGPEVDGVAIAPVYVGGPISKPNASLDVTSAATAQVAGVAALVLERFPTLTNSQLYNRLRSTAKEFCGPTYGGNLKIINAEAAVGGLCVPVGQFSAIEYWFSPYGPSTYTHHYCLQYSGGIQPNVTIEHVTPHPSIPLCGSVTFGAPTGPVGDITIKATIRDNYAPNDPPIIQYFRIRARQMICPPENPNCF